MLLKDERNTDLQEAYMRTIRSLGDRASMMTRSSLIDLTINSCAKRHYVTIEEATERINNLERRGLTGLKSKLAQKQYEAIYRNYLKLAEELKGMRKSDIVAAAINQPAECFYMELSSAKVLFWKLDNKK